MTASLLAFFSPLGVLILWQLIFVSVDMISGVYASLIEGKIITSHKLQRTIVKLFMYSTTVILLHGIDVYMIPFDLCLARISCGLICGIELYSIFENCYRITGNQVFKILTQFTIKKIEHNTGVNIDVELHKKNFRKGKIHDKR